MPGRAIRTLSSGAGRIANQYVAYLQITCLEMEKARKGREKAGALQRVETLDGCLREIEAEKASLLRALAERGAAPAAGAPSTASRPAPPRSAGGDQAPVLNGGNDADDQDCRPDSRSPEPEKLPVVRGLHGRARAARGRAPGRSGGSAPGEQRGAPPVARRPLGRAPDAHSPRGSRLNPRSGTRPVRGR